MRRTRRHQGAAFTAQVAFAAVKGDKTLAEWATQCSVPPTPITEWKQHVLARAVDVVGGTKSPSDVPDLTVLHAKIGPWALEHDC
jgi:transposase